MNKEQEIQPTEKQELAAAAEQTREGPVYQPPVDIFETAAGITIVADMPGVRSGDLSVDLREDVLTIRGNVTPPERETEKAVLREFRWGSYLRQFSLADTIDQSKIEAKLNAGVLRLELPKVEKAKPRQITVKTA